MKTLSVVLVVLVSSQSLAQGMTHVPPWTMVGGKACYEFQDAKKLVTIDADLDAALKKNEQWQELIKNLQEASRQLQMALTDEKNANDLLKNNDASLASRLMNETSRANTAEAKPGMWPAWGIAAGVGLLVGLLAGIFLGVYAAK